MQNMYETIQVQFLWKEKYIFPDNAYNISLQVEGDNVIATYKALEFGDYVKILQKGGTALGVIEKVNKTSCLVFIDKYHSTYVSNNFISLASDEEKEKIKKTLSDNRIKLDYEQKALVYERWRANPEEDYYYIDSELCVRYTRDYYTDTSDKQFRIGNYFKTEEEAKSVANKIKALFNSYN